MKMKSTYANLAEDATLRGFVGRPGVIRGPKVKPVIHFHATVMRNSPLCESGPMPPMKITVEDQGDGTFLHTIEPA